nr:uncharacterized protein LOC113805440 [Penaeus vannamei]
MSHNCTNSTSYATQYEDWLQATQYWAWTLTAVGGVGNLLTILVILHQLYIGYSWKHRPRSSLRRQDSNSRFEKPVLPFEGHTLLLLHLSFCDLLYATVSIPLTAITYGYALDGATQELEGLCPVAAFLRYTNALAEWLTLGLLAFQRCVDLGRWRSARLFKSAATGFLIGGVWAVSVALQLVPFAVVGSKRFWNGNGTVRTILVRLGRYQDALAKVPGTYHNVKKSAGSVARSWNNSGRLVNALSYRCLSCVNDLMPWSDWSNVRVAHGTCHHRRQEGFSINRNIRIKITDSMGGYGYSCENFKCDITNGVLKTIFYAIQSLLPCFMMFTGCVGLLYQLRKYTKEMENMKMVSNVSRKRLVKSSILVLSLLLLFLVCVVPICIHNLIPKDVVSPEVHIPAGLFLYKIYYLQYAINFMLYNIMSANFRSAYRRFFSLFFPSCCSPVGNSSTIYSVSASQSCRSDTQRETLSVCNQSDSIKTSTKF